MRIAIEVNNPFFEATLDDMAQSVGVDVPTLCAGLVEKQATDYAKEVREAKLSAVTWRLTERLNRLILEKCEEEDNAEQ